MLLDENNYKEQIHAFTQQDWQPLIELIPKVESTSKFGEWEEGNILFPYCIEGPIVSQFLHIVYRLPIIISFDWGAWETGKTSYDDFDLDPLDLPAKCKLITSIVRRLDLCFVSLSQRQQVPDRLEKLLRVPNLQSLTKVAYHIF